MNNIPSVLFQIHEILNEYGVIHDAVFKSSWRKAIPIPGIFKPIDYLSHMEQMSELELRFNQIASTTNLEELPPIFPQYAYALSEAMHAFFELCSNLHSKSNGGSYSMAQYKSDTASYQVLIDNYSTLGVELNKQL